MFLVNLLSILGNLSGYLYYSQIGGQPPIHINGSIVHIVSCLPPSMVNQAIILFLVVFVMYSESIVTPTIWCLKFSGHNQQGLGKRPYTKLTQASILVCAFTNQG